MQNPLYDLLSAFYRQPADKFRKPLISEADNTVRLNLK